MTAFALSPLLGFVVCAASHVAVSRARPALPRHHGVLAGVVVGFGLVAGLAVVFAVRSTLPATDRWGAAATWVVAYLALVYFYAFGVFNPGESARRVRLRARGAAGMTLDEILATYNARMIVETRLERMLVAGEIVERGDRYVIGRSVMLSVAKFLVLLKLLFYGAPTEFGRAPRTSSAGWRS
jgi:hypothetical protein